MLEKQMDAAYPSIDKDIDSWLDQIKTKESYNSKYGEVNRLEKLIEEMPPEQYKKFEAAVNEQHNKK